MKSRLQLDSHAWITNPNGLLGGLLEEDLQPGMISS